MPHIRPARPDDVPALHTLIDAAVRGLSVGYYSDEQVESALRHLFGPDTQLIADGTYYVVEDGGPPLAAGGWSRRQTLYGGDQAKRGADPLLDPAVDAARIRAFFVHPSAARRGLGRLLLEHCARAAGEAGFRSLELVATLPGVPLYTALGFTAGERFAAELPDGVTLPVVRMRRTVAPPASGE